MATIATIPSTAPFLDGLVKAILNGDLPNEGTAPPSPEQLAKITLLLPTRRSCRVCGEAFLRLSGQKAVILPKIRPIGDGSEDESLIHDAIANTGGDLSLIDMNPAVSNLERHLVLTQFILKWLQKASTPSPMREESIGGRVRQTRPAEASQMAHELTKLMDIAETEAVDLKNLKELVPEEFSNHWQQTLDFLHIATTQWPTYLANTHQMSMAARRNILLLKEADRLAKQNPKDPVIIAGSTGSIPAAATLMAAVAGLENGAIILPGLDKVLDQPSFDRITLEHPEHPQFGLAKLCQDIGTDRSKVAPLKGTEPNKSQSALLRFLSEALRPSSSTDQWQLYLNELAHSKTSRDDLSKALANISLNITRDPQEEAETIALILRRTASEAGRTAALITPDRLLARRVAVRLEAWGIKVDDSGGRPLAKTMPGAFFDQIIECLKRNFEPAYLLALLKHPLTRLQFERGDVRLAARALEIAALRQPWLGGGLSGLQKTLKAIKKKQSEQAPLHPAIRRLNEKEWELAETLLTRLCTAFAPLEQVFNSKAQQSLSSYLNAHIEVAEALNQTDEGSSQALWQGAAGEHLAKLLAEILTMEGVAPNLTGHDYPDFYLSLIAGEIVRPLTPVHPRLFIWGPFEARLQQPDVVILGGLNEGTWPSASKASPWLSRPMCTQLGLPAPEQHIGYGAHDFASLCCAKEVHITRAAKTDGVQTVPSRWIMRIEALAEGLDMRALLEPNVKEPFARWAALRDEFTPKPPLKAPAPTPPLAARPRRLSVTRIEDWIANPYSIYARAILRLSPLDPLGAPPSTSMKGQIIHEAMEIFTKKYPTTLPDDCSKELNKIADELLDELSIHPQIAAFWHPRFQRFATWFAATEPARRAALITVHTEQDGSMSLNTPGGPFTLSARADRIDELQNGTYHIYDYKTGVTPSLAQVKALFKPQLPLEAAILESGGFKALTKAPVSALSYIEAKGGEPAGKVITLEGEAVMATIEQATAALVTLINEFDDKATPYKALRRKDFKGHYEYDDYAHLARVEEWGINEGEEA